MTPIAALRFGIVTWWISLVAAMGLSVCLESSLPDLLRSYLAWELEQEFSASDFAVLMLGLPVSIVAIVSSIGLYFLKRWGRSLFLYANVAGFIVIGFLGPTVEHSVTMIFGYLEEACVGFIIAVAHFSHALQGESVDA